MLRKVVLEEAFGRFDDTWSPKVAGDVNDMQVKVAKFAGEFVWHHHDDTDDLFLVLSGTVQVTGRDGHGHDLQVVEYGPGMFSGELGQLSGRRSLVDAVAIGEVQTLLVEPEQLRAQRVSAGYFGVYGVSPSVGRAFSPDDEQPGGARVVVLSDGLVQRRFGGNRSIVSQTILLDGHPHTVIGIMPASFFNAIAPAVELWALLRERATAEFETRAWGHHY